MFIKKIKISIALLLLFTTSAYAIDQNDGKNLFKEAFNSSLEYITQLNLNKNSIANISDNGATVSNVIINNGGTSMSIGNLTINTGVNNQSYSASAHDIGIRSLSAGNFNIKSIKIFMDKDNIVFQGSLLAVIKKSDALVLIKNTIIGLKNKGINDETIKNNVNLPLNPNTGKNFTIEGFQTELLSEIESIYNNTKNLNLTIKIRLKFDGSVDFLMSLSKDNGVKIIESVVSINVGDLSELQDSIDKGAGLNNYVQLVASRLMMSIQGVYLKKMQVNLNFSDNKSFLQTILKNAKPLPLNKNNSNVKLVKMNNINFFILKELKENGYLNYKMVQTSKIPLLSFYSIVKSIDIKNTSRFLNNLNELSNDNFVVTINGKKF